MTVQCFACDDQLNGCADCDHTGETRITECPMKLITPDVWAAVEASDDLERFGIMPCGGGSLDQSRAFLEAHRYFRAQVGYWTNEKLKKR